MSTLHSINRYEQKVKMRPCCLMTRTVTVPLALSCLVTFLLPVNGIEIRDASGGTDDIQMEFVDDESIIYEGKTELISQSCAQFSFNYPVQCIQQGCSLDEVTGECKNAHTHPENDHLQQLYSIPIPFVRKKRDADSKCFHFNLSPRICAVSGCKYKKDKRKCVNLDGSEDEEPTARPIKRTHKFKSQPTEEECNQYHGKPRPCGSAGCRFNPRTHRCTEGHKKSSKKSLSCSDMNGKPEACIKTKGCKYVKNEKKCTIGDSNDENLTTTTTSTTTEVPTTTAPPTQEDCSKFDGKVKKCSNAGCAYDKATSKCNVISEVSDENDDGESFTTLPVSE